MRCLDSLIITYFRDTHNNYIDILRKIKNSEHTIIITALLKFRKSNIHVGEYRPQFNQQTQTKQYWCLYKTPILFKFASTRLLTFSKDIQIYGLKFIISSKKSYYWVKNDWKKGQKSIKKSIKIDNYWLEMKGNR